MKELRKSVIPVFLPLICLACEDGNGPDGQDADTSEQVEVNDVPVDTVEEETLTDTVEDIEEEEVVEQCEHFEPYEIEITADPNGLYYHAGRETLYVVDDDNNRILSIGDDGSRGIFAEIPNPSGDPGNDGLGDIDCDDGDWFYVPRFGFGETGLGAVFKISPEGAEEAIEGVDTQWRRIGLDYDDGQDILYVATFNKDTTGIYAGWISVVDPGAGTEEQIITGFQKPVGVLKVGDVLLVTEQKEDAIYKVNLSADPPVREMFIDDLLHPDIMEHAGEDAVYVAAFDEGSGTGYVYRVTLDGSRELVGTGEWEPRGIAFDGLSRIFISSHGDYKIIVIPAC